MQITAGKQGFLWLTMAAVALSTVQFAVVQAAAPNKYRVYIGTYTGKQSKGIYAAEFDPATGALSEPQLVAETPSPSFLALSPDNSHLYAVNELGKFNGEAAGSITAFAVDAASGQLKQLNQQFRRNPVVRALVANYTGGNLIVFPINQQGELEEASSFVQHSGSGGDPRRPKGPHAHSINLDPAEQFAVAADLGLDQVLIYRFEDGKLTPNEPAFAKLAPAAGPRHFAFHPSGKFAYVINELNSKITVFKYDAQRGSLTEVQTLSTLPADFEGNNSTAEVQVHPSGKFVYGSNRGHNSIASFSVDPDSGKLTSTGHCPSGGSTPRNFKVDPSGKFVLAANQQTNNIAVLRVDPASGKLSPTESSVEVGAPVCIKFVPLSASGN